MSSSAERRRKGFTLIETLVAIVIAAVGILTIVELFPIGFAASAKSQSRVTATSIATDILAACRRILQSPTDTNFATVARNIPSTVEATANASTRYVSTANVLGTVTGDPRFFYKLWIEEVIDPYQKYLSAIATTRATANRPLDANYALPDVVGLRRVTVFVRGPFNSSATTAGGANDPNWTGAGTGSGRRQVSAAVEIRMAAYVANYKMATTTTVFQCGPNAADTSGASIPINRVYINSADNFTIFNPSTLTVEETDDTGPASTTKWSKMAAPPANPNDIYSQNSQLLWGANELGLDNVWIGSLAAYNHDFNTTPTGSSSASGESNKIVNIQRDTSGGVRNGYYYLELLHPIRGVAGAPPTAYSAGTQVFGICSLQVSQ